MHSCIRQIPLSRRPLSLLAAWASPFYLALESRVPRDLSLPRKEHMPIQGLQELDRWPSVLRSSVFVEPFFRPYTGRGRRIHVFARLFSNARRYAFTASYAKGDCCICRYDARWRSTKGLIERRLPLSSLAASPLYTTLCLSAISSMAHALHSSPNRWLTSLRCESSTAL